MTKNIRGFLENLFEYYYFNIIVNASFFSDFNITVSATLKYYPKQALNEKLKLMGGGMKYFHEKNIGPPNIQLFDPLDYDSFF